MKGKMTIEIMSGTSGHISTLNLHSDNGNALYVTEGKHKILTINYLLLFSHLGTCKDRTAKTGVMSTLDLSPALTNGSYSNYIHLSSIGSCKVKTHLQFGNSLQINNVSLTSTCLILKINELSFPGLVFKLVLFPNNFPLIPGKKINAFLESYVNQGTIEFGNFVKLLPSSQVPSIQAAMFADEGGIFGILNSANVSLFDAQIPTAIRINDAEINFSGKSNIFNLNLVDIIGRGTTSRKWNSLQLKLNVDTSKALSEGMTQYARNELNKQAEEAIDHIYQANQTLHEAKVNVDDVKIKLANLNQQVKTLNTKIETKRRQKNTFKNEKNVYEKRLHDLLETYWNASNELTDSIESVCQIRGCKKSCRAGDIETLCFTPTFIYESKTCYYYEQMIGTVIKKKEIVKYYCDYGDKGPGVLALVSPKITIIPALVSAIFTTKKKLKCYPKVKKKYHWFAESFMERAVTSKPCNVKKVGNQVGKICNYTSDCAVLVEDSACSALNAYCYNNRSQLIKQFYKDNEEVLINIDQRYYAYQRALEHFTDISFEISPLELKNQSLTKEVISTSSILQSALRAEKIANNSYVSIKNEEKRMHGLYKFIKNNSILLTVKFTRMFFNVTVETQTPVLVPLHVVYEVPFHKTSHEAIVVVDISSSANLIQKTIFENIVDDIIDDILEINSVRKRRDTHITYLSDIFKQNCDLQTKLLHYLNELNSTLEAIHENTRETLSSIRKAKDSAEMKYKATVDVLMEIEANASFVNLLEQKEYTFYQSQLDIFNAMLARVSESEVVEWKTNMEDIHNGSVAFFGQKCYSFSDCLKIALKSLQQLLSGISNPNAMSILESVSEIQQPLLSIASNGSQNYTQINSILTETIEIMQSLVDLDYWCAPPPEITEQPEHELYIQSGDTLKLNCKGHSILPLTYVWKRNNKTIPFATSGNLVIQNMEISHLGVYQCEVRNAVGLTKSHQSIVYVYKIPSFIEHPKSVSTIQYNDTYFICDVSAYPVPVYDWFFRPNATATWSIIKNEKRSLLYITNATYANEGQYHCNSSNDFGSIVSQLANLTVLPGSPVEMSYQVECTYEAKSSTKYSMRNEKQAFLAAVGKVLNLTTTPVLNITFNDYVISFELLAPKILSVNNAEKWFNDTQRSLSELYKAKLAIELSFNNISNPIVFISKKKMYTVKVKSIQMHPLLFKCLVGYEFDLTDLACGKIKLVYDIATLFFKILLYVVGCKPGYYWKGYVKEALQPKPSVMLEIRYPTCSLCDKGSFQDEKAAASCIQCPANYSTSMSGSKSIRDCQSIKVKSIIIIIKF